MHTAVPEPTRPPAPQRPDRFTLGPYHWQARTTLDAVARCPAQPFLQGVLAADAGLRNAAETSADELLHQTRGGLARGDRAVAAAAVARRNGCIHATALHARRAADILRRKCEVELLLEEGIPSPLLGRLGAIIEAAGGLASTPPAFDRRRIWRLEEERLDDQEIVDLVLVAGFAHWSSLLSLALGDTLMPEEADDR